ncbi:MAG: DNA alkylation repair protein [Anaerolineales bacterium]
MKTSEAKIIGQNLANLVTTGEIEAAYTLLIPILSQRTSFSALDQIGCSLGGCPLSPVNNLLERLAADKTMGGWVVIGSALGSQLDRDFEGAFDRCRGYIITADTWYGADIQGERVPGPALVFNVQLALERLTTWRDDPNRWVRRTVGVSVHYWAKKSSGRDEYTASARELLLFLSPMFTEWEMDAAKGVGWGLKTLGKYYPDLVTPWLVEQISDPQHHYRALMLRKAMTYLPDDQKDEILSRVS